MNLGTIMVKFGADIAGLIGGVAGVEGVMKAFSSSILGAVALGGAALLALGITVAAVSSHMAGDFQAGIVRLRTGAGDAQDSFTSLSRGILGVSVATGTMTGPLVTAMYQILSSGQRGAEAMNTLTVAAEGAKIEQANVADVANVVSGAMTNYGTKVYGAAQYMNGLMKAVSLGKVTLQDLAVAMGPIDPIAQKLGVSFADVAAAMTTQTNAMIPANIAATGLRFLMQNLENPTKKAGDAMKGFGLDSVAVANEMRVSLPGALQMVYDAAKQAGPEGSVPFNRALSSMIGGIRGFTAFAALSGTHMADFIRNTQAITNAMRDAKNGVTGWAEVQTNFNTQQDRAKAALAALGISIGQVLIPMMSAMLARVTPLILAFTQWFVSSGGLQSALANVGTIGDHVQAVIGSVGAAFNNAKNGLAALVAILLIAGGAWVGIEVGMTLSAIGAAAGIGPFAALALVMSSIAADALAAAVGFFAGIIPALIATTVAAWATAVAVVAATWPFILIGVAVIAAVAGLILLYQNFAPVRAVVQAVGAAFMSLWGVLTSSFALIWPILSQAFAGLWKSLQQLGAALAPLMPVLEFLGAILGGLIVVALGVLIGLLKGFAQGLVMLIAGVTMVLTGVVQVITGVVQVIVGIFTMLGGLIMGIFTGNWAMFNAGWNGFLQGLVSILSGMLNIIVGLFVGIFGTIIAFVQGFISGVIGFFENMYHAIVGGSIIPDMVNGILSWFSNLISQGLAFIGNLVTGVLMWMVRMEVMVLSTISLMVSIFLSWLDRMTGGAVSRLGGLVSAASGVLNNLIGIAASAGSAMMNALAGAITAGISWVSGAINNVVAAIGNVLPHSPAKEGPLRDLNKFGPAITHGLAQGLLAGLPEVRAAATVMVQPIANSTSGASAGVGSARRGSGGGGDSRPVIIKFSEREIVRALMPAAADEIRIHFGGR